jgi:hypothetical protein
MVVKDNIRLNENREENSTMSIHFLYIISSIRFCYDILSTRNSHAFKQMQSKQEKNLNPPLSSWWILNFAIHKNEIKMGIKK